MPIKETVISLTETIFMNGNFSECPRKKHTRFGLATSEEIYRDLVHAEGLKSIKVRCCICLSIFLTNMPAIADEAAHIRSAFALDNNTLATKSLYKAILAKWPESLNAEVGLGNTYFAQKHFMLP